MNPSKSILTSVLTCLALAQSASAQPLSRTEVTEIKPLLLRAIDQGAAHGVLVGESATKRP